MRLNGLKVSLTSWGLVIVGLCTPICALAQDAGVPPDGGVSDGGTELEPNGDPKNGLSSRAFRRNALTTNQRALEILRSHSLHQLGPDGSWPDPQGSTDAAYLARQLHEPHARAVAAELIKCAIPRDVTLNYGDPVDGQRYRWQGELGLCKTSETGGWLDERPSVACQEIVTACVTARVNALGMAIPLSLRGGTASQLRPRPRVLPEPTFRESPLDQDPAEGTPIPSLDMACEPDGDCGWKTAYVGTCSAAHVTLDVNSHDIAAAQLRVCAGIHGCTAPSASSPPYARYIDQFTLSSGASSVEFSCPVDAHARGFYSVLIRGPQSLPWDRDSFEIKARPAGSHYPATETEVFGFVEGAFYGNLFEPDQLLQSCEVDAEVSNQMVCRPLRDVRSPPDVCTISCGVTTCRRDTGAVPYTNVHACYSPAQEVDSESGPLGVAYLNSRICDRPDGTCFFEPPVPCTGPATDSAGCTWNTEAGYQDCKDRHGVRAGSPITTALNETCDLIGEGVLCDGVRRTRDDKPGGCGGGARACSAGGSALLIAGGVLLVLLRRRRLAQRLAPEL